MQNIISAFINGALSAYMVEAKSNNITGSLAHKNLGITELEIFPDAMLQHGLPILIKKGFIKNVDIHVPTKITSEPIIITIDSVTIFANIYTCHPTPKEIIDMKIRLLKSYKYFRKRYKMILGFLQKSSFISFFRNIMTNVIIEINHLHIRIEYSSKNSINTNLSSNLPTNLNNDENGKEDKKTKDLQDNNSSDDEYIDSSSDEDMDASNRFKIYEQYNDETNVSEEKVTAIGIIIKKLKLQNPDNYKKESNEKITKEVVFSDLAVYMDADQASVNSDTNEQFISQMDNLYNSNDHNWILKPFSFKGLIKYEKDNPALIIEPIMNKILVNIREEYIPLLLELMKEFDTFQKVISVAHIPKPSFKCPHDFWCYIHNCALTKISNPSYEFKQNICLLIQRVIFIKNYKKKNEKSLAIIKEMEETLNYSTIVAFRAAYRLLHKKKKAKGQSKITSRTTNKIINEIKIDPIYLVAAMIDMLSINMKSELITVTLSRNPGKKHIIFDIKKLNLRFDKDLKSYQIHVTVSYIGANYKNGREKSTVFMSIDNTSSEMKGDIVIPFHSYSNWAASFDVSKNNYTINMKSLLQIIADLSHLQFAESVMNSAKIIDFLKRRKFRLIVRINSSEIKIVGSKNTRAIEYAFDKLYFSTDTNTLEGTFNLSNSWISLITTQAAKVSSDFSIIGSMKGKNVNITIPLFSCTIPFQYIVVIQDFIELFMQYQDLINVTLLPKININSKLVMNGIDINLNLPKHKKQKNLQIRKIKLKYKHSVFNFKLSLIKIGKLFSLRNLKARYDIKSLNVKLQYISVKVIDLIELIPKNAIEMIHKQNSLPVINENTDNFHDIDSDTNIIVAASSDVFENNNIKLPKISIGCKVEKVKLDLKITNDVDIKFRIKNINANININKIIANALLEKIKIENQIIAKQI